MVEIKTPTTPIKAQKTEIITANNNAAVSILGSSKLQVTPADYVIAQSTYDGNVPKGISQWIQNEISRSIAGGDIFGALENIRTTLMDSIELGVNQYIETLQTDYVSQSSLITTLGSAIGAVDAKILNVQQTFATENEAFATEITGLRARLGDDGSPGAIEAFIGNIALTRVTPEFASATDANTLFVSYNDLEERYSQVDVKLESNDFLMAGHFPEWDGIVTPEVGMYKVINGIHYTYVGGTLGEFADGWMRSIEAPYTYTDNLVYSLAESTGISLDDLKNQIDGVIDSWYYSYMPDQTKLPWSTWISTDTANGNTNEQIAHSGDLFYDLTTGTAYRFALSEGVYGWAEITDTAITLALSNAATAQYTADGKAAVYYSETVPIAKVVNGVTIPIEIGDLWVKISTGITKVAIVDNASILSNWGEVTNTATDNALLSIADLEEARDGNIVVYYLTTTGAATGMTYGDYLVDIDSWNGVVYTTYRYENSIGGSSGTLGWYVNIGEISKALSSGYRAQVLANTAQGTADGKAQIIYSTTAPTTTTHPLLDTGDQWVDTDDGIVKVWTGTSWVNTSNQSAVDARNGVLHNAVLASPPTATGMNDVWVVTDRWYDDLGIVVTTSGPTGQLGKYKNLVKVWNGSTWVQQTLAETQGLSVLWVGGASKLLYGPDGGVTGWEFANGGGLQSEFKVNAQKFSVSDGVTGYTPFSISGSNILFNGVVDFTNTNTFGTTTIDGGKITTGSITSGQIAANSITANMLTAGAVTVDTLDFSTVELRNAWAESIGTVLLENTTMVQQFFQAANDGASLSIYKTAVPTFRYSNGYSGYINMWRTATTVEFLFYDNEYGTWNKSMPVITQISSGDQKVFITIDLRGDEGANNLNPAVLEFTYATFSAIPTSPTRVWTHVYEGGGALEIDVICSLMSSYVVSGVDIINYLNTSLGGMATKIGRVFNVGTTDGMGILNVVLPYGMYVAYRTSGADILLANEIVGVYTGDSCKTGTYTTKSAYTKAISIYKHNTIMKIYFAYSYRVVDSECYASSEQLAALRSTLVKLLKIG